MDLDRSPEQLIKAGLAALKQKDYGRAIATFQQLRQTEHISTSHRIKAQMGLIQTYEAQGNHGQAQILCKPLLESRSQAIRQWAYDKLHQLASDTAPPSVEQSVNNAEIHQGSGFIPFSATSSTVDPAPPTTIAPLTDDGLKKNTAAAQTTSQEGSEQFVTHSSPGKGAHGKSTNSPAQDIANSQPRPPSLFHYQTLNSTQGSNFTEVASISEPSSKTDSKTGSDTDSASPSPVAQRAVVISAPERRVKGNFNRQQQPTSNLTQASLEGPKTWPQGTRLSTLKSLGKVNMGRLWFAQLTTIPILFFVVRWLVRIAVTLVRDFIQFFDRLLPINLRPAAFFWGPQTWTVIIGLGLLTIAAPWLWSWLLRPASTLTGEQLETYSPESNQLLRRLCTKRRWPLPKIQLLASELPLIFSYGWRPRYGRLVVSQGLLDQLEADELAAVIIYEISHWSTLDWVLLSTHGLLLQGCHRVYWGMAQWGENRPTLSKVFAGTLSTVSYGIFWLLAKVGCGLPRTRTPYRDRTTAELTGNPNGLVRALAKLSAAMAEAVAQQGYTPPLLESLDLMLPVGPGEVAASGQYFAWGAFNSLRHWLSINQAHPPLGDRLYTLGAYGRHWRLKPSLNFAHLRLKNGSREFSPDDWQNLLLQGGAWSGLIVGLGVSVMMWVLGAIATRFDVPLLAWLYQDRSILISMPLIGAATGQLLRINPFFPETAASPSTNATKLAQWQTDPELTPINSRPVKISGTLTGRPALANWLGQEWRLGTTHGSIKLHHTGYLGPISNINGLADWLHQPINITGWFRRGHHMWIDIDRIQTHQNQIKLAHHPLWSTIVSLLPLFYGLWLIFRGS
ncbi:MAG: M48 family metalloprotease [Cyanobacteria bacterium J06627_3]